VGGRRREHAPPNQNPKYSTKYYNNQRGASTTCEETHLAHLPSNELVEIVSEYNGIIIIRQQR